MREMSFYVPMLPASELTLVGSARERAEYNRAREEMRGEVVSSIPAGQYEFSRAHLVVVALVSQAHGGGRYRPESGHGMHDTLDPIYEALVDSGAIRSKRDVAWETVGVERVETPAQEGLRIVVKEIE